MSLRPAATERAIGFRFLLKLRRRLRFAGLGFGKRLLAGFGFALGFGGFGYRFYCL